MSSSLSFRALLLIGFLGSSVGGLAADSPAEAQSAQLPTRERIRLPRPPAVSLEGRVVDADADVIVTNISADRWQGHLYTGAFVWVHIGGRTLRTRFLEPEAYAELTANSPALEGLDVDVVCTPDESGSVIIVGLGGDLADWLRVKPRMPVLVETVP